MAKPLLGPDGKPIPRTLLAQHGDKFFPLRYADASKFSGINPVMAALTALVQQGDTANILWYAMYTLAKDVYSRDPKGTRHFQELAQTMGLSVTHTNEEGVDKLTIDIAKELATV